MVPAAMTPQGVMCPRHQVGLRQSRQLGGYTIREYGNLSNQTGGYYNGSSINEAAS